MGCVGCKKNRKAREAAKGETLYITCVGCETVLHGRKKDMKRIDGNLVCGECYKRYKKMTTRPNDKLVIPVKLKIVEEKAINDLSAWKKDGKKSKNI